jgi:Secretion system C-terminal sorting domain
MKKNLLLLSAFLLTAVGFAQAPSFTTAPVYPTSVAQTENVTITFKYTSAAATQCEIQIFRNDAAGVIYNGNSAYKITDLPAATDTEVSIVVPVSATAGLTADIPYDITVNEGTPPMPVVKTVTKFTWFCKLTYSSGDVYAANPAVEVLDAATLGVRSQSLVDAKEMFVNSAAKSLVVNTANVKVNKADIYNIAGKKVSTINNLKNTPSVDLSSLGRGVYLLKREDNKSIKFVF